jgi:nitrate/nitrite-specific signal transduction histidine kinase
MIEILSRAGHRWHIPMPFQEKFNEVILPLKELFNAAKHANTKEATLILRQEEGAIYLVIEDKGAGIKS